MPVWWVLRAAAWCALAIVSLQLSVGLLAAVAPSGLDVVSMGTLEVLVIGGLSLFAAIRYQPPVPDESSFEPSLRFLGLGQARASELLIGLGIGAAIKPAADSLRVVIEARWPTSEVELAARAEFLRHDSPGQLLALFLMVGLLGPIVEEMLYRGLAYRLLLRGVRVWVAIVLSSSFFATAHAAVRDWPSLMGVALVLGVARAASERIWACIAAHVSFNCAALLMLVSDYEIRLGVGLGHPLTVGVSLLLGFGLILLLRRVAQRDSTRTQRL